MLFVYFGLRNPWKMCTFASAKGEDCAGLDYQLTEKERLKPDWPGVLCAVYFVCLPTVNAFGAVHREDFFIYIIYNIKLKCQD